MYKLSDTMRRPAVRSAAGLLLSFAGGFIFSGTALAGAASFADISLAGALDLPYAAAVLAGAIVRGVSADSVGKGIVKTAAMAFIVIAKLFAGGRSSPMRCGIITAVSVMLAGTSVSALIGELPQKLIFYGFYAAVAGFAAYCGAELTASLRQEHVISLSGFSGGCYAVIYIVYIASLYSLSLPAVNAGAVVGIAVTALAAYSYGSAGGAICGAMTAFAAALVSPRECIASAVFPAAGLFAGHIRKGRPLLTALIFAALCYSLSVLTGAPRDGSDITLSVLIGGGVFVAAAPYFSDKWVSAEPVSERGSSASDSLRISFLSDVIDAVRSDAVKLSAALSAAENNSRSAGISTCGSCSRGSTCRRLDIEAADELAPDIPQSCVRKRELTEELEQLRESRIADRLLRLRRSRDRSLLNEQLKLTGEILRSAAAEHELRPSGRTAAKIIGLLSAHGIAPLRASASYNAANRLAVELYYSSENTGLSASRIRDLIADGLGLELTVAAPVSSADELRLCFYEKPEYTVEVYSASVCAEGSEVSGDSTAVFTDGGGICYIALSDGMGTGKSAAVDSHTVIALFRRLVCGGMDCVTAVKMVNSVMVGKSRDESFATFDALRFDPDSHTLTVMKSGAAATLILRGGEVQKVSAPTFPVGINEAAEVYTAEYEVGEGDMVVAFSDGISENEFPFIRELLIGSGDIKEIVRETALKSASFCKSAHTDDVTVIGVKILRNKQSI